MLLATINQLWHAVPLVVSISLVYAATRQEYAGPILAHAVRLGVWITGFMAAVAVVLYGLSLWL